MQHRSDDADVIVVGAGPAGSSTAHWCASAGLDVLLLEKAEFPRDKICGDGLTPRAVAELARMGVATDERDGWIRNRGLRVHASGRSWELDWPDLASFPAYGMAHARKTLDHKLAQHAQASGAKLHTRTKVTGAVTDERTGRVAGVTAQPLDGAGRPDGPQRTFRAPVVVASDGVSSRLATGVGRLRRDDRPMGTAVRGYYRTPLHADPFMESHLELWAGEPGRSALLPGYGWVFPLGDGTANVGLGSVHSTPARQSAAGIDYRSLQDTWLSNSAPAGSELSPEAAVGRVRGAALPMGFNRGPLYDAGLLLAGDAAGMVSPFNGEGIAYGLQAGRVAADAIVTSRQKRSDDAREAALEQYTERMRGDLGGYYTLGRYFVRLIEQPQVMRACVKYGLPRKVVMQFVLKFLSDCYEPNGGDWIDRTIALLTKVVPRS
ncbi:geranylgeranyl reductase family protein [Myceligenerans crystallogenes]|uniref:Geranylgeranyl reductase family protein n=1 Tax=Myceligenerans crystallogenes TaxID=316335 RepID=A0ABN2N3H4_9MICO